ncbi:hypothetical protein RTBOTA2_006969 [Rhodotorula toruloides]|nr:hypothetical protein RTBOTA2_006969 [Rhodotorula toruloides]
MPLKRYCDITGLECPLLQIEPVDFVHPFTKPDINGDPATPEGFAKS